MSDEIARRQLAGMMTWAKDAGAFNPKPQPVSIPYTPPTPHQTATWGATQDAKAAAQRADDVARLARFREQQARAEAEREAVKARREVADREAQIEKLMTAQRSGGMEYRR